jgi:hypothetical protein
MESLRFGPHASASPATQVGLAALSQPGSHMGAEVILLDLERDQCARMSLLVVVYECYVDIRALSP